ncbi:MAG: hypothetical protein ACT4PV_05440 [Planctomycetaceae bacterium]
MQPWRGRPSVLGAALVLCAAALGQDGGRDSGTEGKPLLFLRWRRTPESARVYAAMWQALERHFGVIARRRLAELDGDKERALAFLARNADAAAVIALDAESAAAATAGLPGALLLTLHPGPGTTVDTRADREQWSGCLALFKPGARRIALFGPAEMLPGYVTVVCTSAEQARGCDLAWVSEGGPGDAAELRRALDALRIPLVTTSPLLPDEQPALRLRPDAAGVGRRAAAIALWRMRDGAEPPPGRVSKMTLSLDLRAARAAGHEIPLAAIARADSIRR